RDNEPQPPPAPQELQPLLDEGDVDVPVARGGGAVELPVHAGFFRCPLAEGLDPDVRRVAYDAGEASGTRGRPEIGAPAERVDPLDQLLVGEQVVADVLRAE